MAITIKQHGNDWRIIVAEEWEFKDDKKFEEALNQIIKLKKEFGKVKDFKGEK